ncbi:MAG TPA: PIG-L family deacetylase [Pyrinomonadaceae bacterium]|nr:PIG-L family deacetylase [Pyrinomonadaceae bacterium]
MSRNILAAALLVLCVFASLPREAPAQIRPIYDQGQLGLAQQLKRLNTNASALMIGAHPDDEDTALLTYLARGENARTAYLSLTRGDGGQNIIGPELGEALGVIRTEELLQARKLDGAEQFFTRAYDYGFSKTLDEAKSKWDEKIILCDVVRVIRSYRPLVVIAQFSGTPADGHGQHQFSGYIAPIAVKAAADASQCADTGVPWSVKKFYVRQRGQGEPNVRINTGTYDPLLGRSYFEIAMHARSQHRSQEQGVLELKGDQFSTLNLVGAPAGTKENSVFDGLDVSVPRLLKVDGGPAEVAERLPELSEVFLRASGIRIDLLADRETAVPGESVPVSVRVFAAAGTSVKIDDVKFNLPFEKATEPTGPTGGFFRRETGTASDYFGLKIPNDVPITQPYWLESRRAGDLFSTAGNMPLGDPAVFADLSLTVGDKKVIARRSVQYRYADDIRGEIRRELNIVPKVTVELDRQLMIVSTRDKQSTREVSLSVTNNSNGAITGRARLSVPDGWVVTPAASDFAMKRKGEKASTKFSVRPPASVPAGSVQIKADATVDGATFSQTMQTIAYEHVQTHRIYRPAASDVRVIDVQTLPVKVGYIRGSGDRVPDAIRQLGLTVEELDESALASGDLSKFDTIVVGIRAYQVRSDIVSYNQRLLDFVNNGGTLIVQYQLPQTYTQQNLTPLPAQAGPRVSDENAAVTIVEPANPIFNVPNKITQDDFKGWVQERNLYNFSTMDPKYVGLLESHDSGEPVNNGGLVVAELGKGKYVYCSYSLFRQLPAGVPGAYRLLANLVSFSKAGKRG